MAEVSPIQTKDNSQLYATAAAAGAGAAIGGVGGYLTKPFLKDGKLTDEFIKKAEENLTDDAKKVMAENSPFLSVAEDNREFIEQLKKEDFSDASVMKQAQESAKKRIEVLHTLPEKINGAKTLSGLIREVAKQDETVAKVISDVIIKDSTDAFDDFINEIKKKHGSSLSTDIIRQVEEAKTPNQLAGIIKPYDEEISGRILKVVDSQKILDDMKTDSGLKSQLDEEIEYLKKIADAKSYEELKGAINNIPEDRLAKLLFTDECDVVNLSHGERLNKVKASVIRGIDASETKIIEQINTAKDAKEIAQIIETGLNEGIAIERHSLISGCWDSAKKEFINTENALGESVKKTAGSMKTRAALIYGAIGAAVLGLVTYLASGKSEPTEAKVDTKA